MVARSNKFGYKWGMEMTNQPEPTLVPDAVFHPLVVYRKRYGLTQKGLAAKLDVARETVARWERGRPIDTDLLPRVSQQTGIAKNVLRPDLAKLMDEPQQ
jgi:DNA-binding XRE family transcriptional regulator